MTIKPRPIRRFMPLAILSVVATVILITAGAFNLSETFWPAWVQAIGSIGAILVAVWVSWDQAAQQRYRDEAKEREEIQGTLRSLRAEVGATLRYFRDVIAPVLDQSDPERPSRTTFPLPEYPFPIFDALIPKLGMIPSGQLQTYIIHAYALAKSLAMTIRHHNHLVEDFIAAESRYSKLPSDENAQEFARCDASLTAYGDTFRASFIEARGEMDFLHNALLATNPGA